MGLHIILEPLGYLRRVLELHVRNGQGHRVVFQHRLLLPHTVPLAAAVLRAVDECGEIVLHFAYAPLVNNMFY